jgi:hypothetical protein
MTPPSPPRPPPERDPDHPMPLTPEASRELTALARSLAALVGRVVTALADGLVTVDELVSIGCAVPDLVAAIADLATPTDNATRIARVRAAEEKRRAVRGLMAGKRRAVRARNRREKGRAVVK